MTHLLLDAFGTVVRIARPTNPYRLLFDELRLRPAKEAVMISTEPIESILTTLGVNIAKPEAREALGRFHWRLDRELTSIEIYPDAEELLALMADNPPWIVSNLAAPYVLPLLDLLAGRIAGASLSCFIGCCKPAAAIYQHALDGLGATANDTLMVGDSHRCDLLGPAACGISSLRLMRKREPADAEISSLLAVIAHLAGNC